MTPSPQSASDVRSQLERVLKIEAEALLKMAATLGEPHEKAVDLLYGVRGRVIVSGVGKSGHIGRKIAATLASTGTPAQFVHPTEASHGDLGMITADDVCIAISNSGESSELSDLITYTRRFGIPLIAITRRAASTLGEQADVVLLLPDAPEACIIGVAPTTSTTATLALGDALVVALMYRRGFRREDFQVFHPGGKLGAQLAKVGSMMHQGDEVPLLGPDTPMREGLITMTSKGFGIAGVSDARGILVGVVSDGDLRRNLDELMTKTAGEIATRSPKTVRPDTLASEALKIMTDSKISALFVVEDENRVVGLLHIHDCLRSGVA